MRARDLEDVRQVRDRAFHREYAVRPNKTAPCVRGTAKLVSQILHVTVLIDGRRALADRLRKPHRIDDRRVIQGVGDDEVTFRDYRTYQPFIGVPCRDEAQRRLGADESGERFLELAMNRERSAV